MRRIIITFIFLIGKYSYSQTLGHQALTVTGASVSSGSLLADYSVGSLIVGENSSGSISISFGYQQFFGSNIGLVEADNWQIKVYPVPTQDNVTVELPDLIADGARLWMTTTEGRTIMLENSKFVLSRGVYTQLKLEELPAGTYFLFVSHPKIADTQVYRISKVL